jgi:uncharacterized protein YecE (DUF72 family)
MAGKILVGTSSWADPGFVEEWYPQGLPAKDRLPFYAERFRVVEVNSSFYAVPERDTVGRWARITPDDFVFDVKLHRLLSRHAAPLDSLPGALRRRVRTTARGRVVLDERLQCELCRRTLAVVQPLRDAGRLTTLLLQLSPAFEPRRHELPELEPLIEALAPVPVAIELRHRAWLKDPAPTLAWFSEVGAAFVAVDAPQVRAPTALPPLDAVTRDDVAYLRAHGRNAQGYVHGRTVAERFGYRYSDPELEEIGRRARELAATAANVRLMFNNNRGSDAPEAAARMRELLSQPSSS